MNPFVKWGAKIFVGVVMIRVVLLDLSNFSDVQEIRQALVKTEGVQRVNLLEEAPGLITWEVAYDSPSAPLIEKLQGHFDDRYRFQQKNLTGGGVEINVAKPSTH